MTTSAQTREFEYWTPEPIFAGKTVFCLASGPSLTSDVLEMVKGRCSIVVNSSCMFAPWASILYFTDSSWYIKRKDIVANWPGLVVSMARHAKIELPDKVKRVKGYGEPSYGIEEFPARGSGVIRQGISSGHTAVSLAVAAGARTIVLLGYDMRLVDGREHCHDEYTHERDLEQYARSFVPGFLGWYEAGRKMGTEILNATPGSAIEEFPFVDLQGFLEAEQLAGAEN